MSVRIYSKPKNFTQLLVNIVADIIVGTMSTGEDIIEIPPTKNKNKTPKKVKNKVLSDDTQKTLELINKKLREKGLSQKEIKEKTENRDFQNLVEFQMKTLQEQMCEKIKNKIEKNSNMCLEFEEILEDDSIVLTVNL